MKKIILITSGILLLIQPIISINKKSNFLKNPEFLNNLYSSAKPYTRWWWFASIIKEKDIAYQLDWIKDRGFGGVEIAFIYPVNRNPNAERIKFLSSEWTNKITFAKKYAQNIGLGCDFTFGTLWPFGGTFVKDKDRTKVYGNKNFKQPLRLSWTHPKIGNVLDHLNKNALYRYAKIMGDALKPALKRSPSGLFCDSWEVETRKIWTNGFGEIFIKRYGYDLKPYMKNIYSEKYKQQRYDYMKLVSEFVINEFYKPFTKKCHELGSFSRVQCAGSPTDILKAYSCGDVPETEAMLYNPNYSRIVSSTATLSRKPIVSSETFTCLYGWPDNYHLKEQTADLKLVCDSLFAKGVNQIIWHGKPYNSEISDDNYFYATVHIGRKGNLSHNFSDFNKYMTKVSKSMRRGKNYSDIAVYLPLEDSWIAGEYPEELQMKWSWGAYELRYIKPAKELKGYQPIWINGSFLKHAKLKNNKLYCGDAVFSLLYIDVKYIEADCLDTILRYAEKGLPVCLKKIPKQAGYIKEQEFKDKLKKLFELKNVSKDFLKIVPVKPLIEGKNLPIFWSRIIKNGFYIFFAHPKATNLKYPLSYGQSLIKKDITIPIKINLKNKSIYTNLNFKPYQSILLKISNYGNIKPINIYYKPPQPIKENQ